MKYLPDEKLVGQIGWLLFCSWSNRILSWSGLRLTITNKRFILRYFGLIPVFQVAIADIKYANLGIFDPLLPWPALRVYYTSNNTVCSLTLSTFGKLQSITDLLRKVEVEIRSS